MSSPAAAPARLSVLSFPYPVWPVLATTRRSLCIELLQTRARVGDLRQRPVSLAPVREIALERVARGGGIAVVLLGPFVYGVAHRRQEPPKSVPHFPPWARGPIANGCSGRGA